MKRGTIIVLRETGSQTKYSGGLNPSKEPWGNTCSKSLVTLVFDAVNLIKKGLVKHSTISGFLKGNRFMIS